MLTLDQKRIAVHFFDHTGFSVLSGQHLTKRNEELERENERLKDQIRRLQTRMKQQGLEDNEPLPRN